MQDSVPVEASEVAARSSSFFVISRPVASACSDARAVRSLTCSESWSILPRLAASSSANSARRRCFARSEAASNLGRREGEGSVGEGGGERGGGEEEGEGASRRSKTPESKVGESGAADLRSPGGERGGGWD